MVVLVICKNEEDLIRHERAGVVTTSFPLSVNGDFFKRSRAANSAVHGRIYPNFELIRDLMTVLSTCKNEEDPIKNVGARVFTTLSPLQPYGSYLLTWKPEF